MADESVSISLKEVAVSLPKEVFKTPDFSKSGAVVLAKGNKDWGEAKGSLNTQEEIAQASSKFSELEEAYSEEQSREGFGVMMDSMLMGEVAEDNVEGVLQTMERNVESLTQELEEKNPDEWSEDNHDANVAIVRKTILAEALNRQGKIEEGNETWQAVYSDVSGDLGAEESPDYLQAIGDDVDNSVLEGLVGRAFVESVVTIDLDALGELNKTVKSLADRLKDEEDWQNKSGAEREAAVRKALMYKAVEAKKDDLKKKKEEKQVEDGHNQAEGGDEDVQRGEIEEMATEGLQEDGDVRGALLEIAGGETMEAVAEVAVSILTKEGKTELYSIISEMLEGDENLQKLQRDITKVLGTEEEENKEQSFDEVVERMTESENPYIRALGYDLKIASIRDNSKISNDEKERRIRRARDKRGQIEATKEVVEGDTVRQEAVRTIEEGEMISELYTFISGEEKEGEVGMTDISDAVLGLATDEGKKNDFIDRLVGVLPDDKKDKMRSVLNGAFSLMDAENRADEVIHTAKKERNKRRVKMGAGIGALVTLLILWKAFKSENAEQR